MGLTDFPNKKSLTLLLLPFITNFFINESSIAIVASFLLFFLLIDVFVFSKLNNKLLLIAVFVFLLYFSILLFFTMTRNMCCTICGLGILVISSVCFLIVFSAVVYYNLYQFVNVFLLFFSLSFLLSIGFRAIQSLCVIKQSELKPLQKTGVRLESSNAPLILVILDELSSGRKSFLYSKDSLT